MSDHHRVHPSQDPEAAVPQTPTAPTVTPGFSKSDGPGSLPVGHSGLPARRRSCCCRLLCWTLSLLVFLAFAVGITAGILFLVFRPKLPEYSIDRLRITQFGPGNDDDSLNATFSVTITATNPNRRIGIHYKPGSLISVLYTDSELCRGSFPRFYQGHRNKTVVDVQLTGQTPNATALVTSVQQQKQETGFVPLNIRVRQPVRIELGKLKLPELKFVARCRIDVDSLTARNAVRVKSSSCKFRLRL